jgi:hypothetical protein
VFFGGMFSSEPLFDVEALPGPGGFFVSFLVSLVVELQR